MDVRQLRYLIALAEEGHVGRAAARVHITQPALSQQLHKLEKELSVQLIERHYLGVRLTPAGEVLLPYAYDTLRQINDAMTAVINAQQVVQGAVTVGSLQAINIEKLPRAAAQLIAKHPKVVVKIEELPHGEIESGVLEGRLDFGVSFLPVTQATESLEAEILCNEELALVVRKDHPLAIHSMLPLKQIATLSLALLPRSFQIRRKLEDAAHKEGWHPNVSLEVDTIHGLIAIAHASGLPTVLPAMVQSGIESNLKFLRLTHPTLSYSIGLIQRSSKFRSTACNALVNEVRSILA